MPLVFAVLIIIVLFVNAKDSKKRRERQTAQYAYNSRKTNARLEQKIMDTYMKHGHSADEAFRKSYEDIIAAGYEPCIPRDAYGGNSSSCWDSGKGGPERFDSFWVKQRREAAIQEWLDKNPGELSCDAPIDEIDTVVYEKFPNTEGKYLYDIERLRKRNQAEPVGTFIIYPGLGTCEILAHNWIGDGYFGGTYTLKVLKTGQIVSHVKIGDNKISRQGQR